MRNRERNRTRRRARGEVIERNPGSRTPFRRITLLLTELEFAVASKKHPAIVEASAALNNYRSRGHGRAAAVSSQRSCLSRTLRDVSKYTPAACFAEGKR